MAAREAREIMDTFLVIYLGAGVIILGLFVISLIVGKDKKNEKLKV